MATLTVEVVYALPERQQVERVTLQEGATAADAARASGITAPYAGIAIFGEKVTAAARLRDGDRVELLRPLAAAPQDARRRRAARNRGT